MSHIAVRAAAAGVLVLGIAASRSIVRSGPVLAAPDAGQIRTLAAAIPPLAAAPALAEPPAPEIVRPATAPAQRNLVENITRGRGGPAGAPPQLPEAEAGAETNAQPAAPPAPEPSIALRGVTSHGDVWQAWLVDASSGEQKRATAGETAFGFTVTAIEPEAAVVSRGTDTFRLRLGHKRPLRLASEGE